MWHARKIDYDRLAADCLAKRDRQTMLGFFEILASKQFAQINGLALLVRQFDADDISPLHDGNTSRESRHRARDIIGKADDPRGFDARGGLKLIKRYHRAWPHVEDLALDAKILKHAF